MYVWREVQTKAGFTEDMTSLRNAMAREINLIVTPPPENEKLQEHKTQELASLKANRERFYDRLTNPIARSKVQLGLLHDVLVPRPDFEAADRFVRYFELDIEDLGKDLYYEMKDKESLYQQLIQASDFSTVWKFLDFFTLEDAQFELRFLFETAAQKQLNDAVQSLLNALSQLRYKSLRQDPEMKKLLIKEYERAEQEKRVEHAQRIVQFISDQEFLYRMQAMIALANRDFENAIRLLQRIQDKSNLRNMIIDCYWDDVNVGKDNIEGMERAFAYAVQGGLVEDEDAQYIHFPAGKIFEYYMLQRDARDSDYRKCDETVKYCSADHVINVMARKFLDLLEAAQLPLAQKLKARYHIKFPPNGYEGEKAVMAMHARLTETGSGGEAGKGETNLQTALELVELFDFPAEEVRRIRLQVCKFYLSKRKIPEARQFYRHDEPELVDYVETEIYKMIVQRDIGAAYHLINELKFRFSRQTRAMRRNEIRSMTAKTDVAPSILARAIAIDDIMDLRALQQDVYQHYIEATFEDSRGKPEELIDLAQPVLKHMGIRERIYLHQRCQELHASDPDLAGRLEQAYGTVLPPGFFDWLLYFIMRLFRLI